MYVTLLLVVVEEFFFFCENEYYGMIIEDNMYFVDHIVMI